MRIEGWNWGFRFGVGLEVGCWVRVKVRVSWKRWMGGSVGREQSVRLGVRGAGGVRIFESE